MLPVKRFFLMSVVFLLGVAGENISAEPLTLQPALPTVKDCQWEIGLSNVYYAEYELSSAPGTEYKLRTTNIPLLVKYGLLENWEVALSIPYYARDYSESGGADSDENGLGDIILGTKSTFFQDEAFAWGGNLAFSLPTGDAEKGLGEGFNTEGTLLFLWDWETLKIHLNTGYTYTGTYDIPVLGTEIEINPGERFNYGLGIELPWGYSKALSILTELNGRTVTKREKADSEVADSDGTAWEFVPAIAYQTEQWKSKLGVAIATADEDERIYDRAYDWKLILQLTRLF